MGVLDRIRSNDNEGSGDVDAQQEQLAADDPAPRGEDRDAGFLVSVFGNSFSGSRVTNSTTRSAAQSSTDEAPKIEAVRSTAPSGINSDHHDYFEHPELGFTRAGLKLFALTVTEPGYRLEATQDGETDEQMQNALRRWASSCAIHGGERDQPFETILQRAPIERYSRATGFIEKAGTRENPRALSALIYHDPGTFTQYLRKNKTVVIQPDDRVDRDHPRAPRGDGETVPAAYVQYDSASGFDTDSVKFAADDVLKLTFDTEPGETWGTRIWEGCGSRIDALVKKLKDRDASIETVGHNHRIYSNENWSMDRAEEYATKHKSGDVSAGPRVADHSNDREGYRQSFAGRVDFVPSDLDVTTVEGKVADIDDAVKDDIEAIFSVLPVSKPKIAYATDINQYVIDPLDDMDGRLIDEERRTLEWIFEKPVFQAKADELAGGVAGDGAYSGEVSFSIESEPASNPLQRSDFPRENFEAAAGSVESLLKAGASESLVWALLGDAGYDRDDVQEEYGQPFNPEEFAPESRGNKESTAGQSELGEAAADEGAETGSEGDN